MDREVPIFRRRKGGRWEVVGADHLVVAGETATVARKDGTTTQVLIEEVSDPFWEDGVRKRWGRIAEQHTDGPPQLF